MEHLQKAQKKLNEITLKFIAINSLVVMLMDENNNVKQYGEQLVEIGKLLDSTANALGEAAGLIATGSQGRIAQLLKEGRFE